MNEEDVVLVVGMAIIVAMELLKRLRLVGSARALVKQAMVAGMAALGVMMANNWVPYEGMARRGGGGDDGNGHAQGGCAAEQAAARGEFQEVRIATVFGKFQARAGCRSPHY